MCLQAGDADHEEFVQVVGGNRQETQPLEQRVMIVAGLFQDAPVEGQPAQLAVEVSRLGSSGYFRSGLDHRIRQLCLCGSGHSFRTCCCHGPRVAGHVVDVPELKQRDITVV